MIVAQPMRTHASGSRSNVLRSDEVASNVSCGTFARPGLVLGVDSIGRVDRTSESESRKPEGPEAEDSFLLREEKHSAVVPVERSSSRSEKKFFFGAFAPHRSCSGRMFREARMEAAC